jgi:protoporphyrinogen oxidase
VAGKIDPMSLPLFILSALGYRTVGRAYQSEFIYPRNGIQGFINFMATTIRNKIRLNEDVGKLKYRKGKWIIHEMEFDIVVSTIPLPELLWRLELNDVQKKYDELRWNNTRFVMIGLKEGCRFGKYHNCHWAFFKWNEIFYRLTFMHNFSDRFLPTVVAEVTDRNSKEVKDFVLKDLLMLGVIEHRKDIATMFERMVEYTYPIPTIKSDLLITCIENRLERYNLHLVGRSGRWKYINMDGVIKEVDEYVANAFNNNRRD